MGNSNYFYIKQLVITVELLLGLVILMVKEGTHFLKFMIRDIFFFVFPQKKNPNRNFELLRRTFSPTGLFWLRKLKIKLEENLQENELKLISTQFFLQFCSVILWNTTFTQQFTF